MNIADTIKTQQAAANDAARAVYLNLIHKAAKSDDGNLAEQQDRDDFATAVKSLGYSAEQVETDLEAIGHHATLLARIDALTPQADKLPEVTREFSAHDAETESLNAARKNERLIIDAKFTAANSAASERERFRQQLAEHRRTNWQLLKLSDPNSIERKRHLFQMLHTFKLEGATADVIALENLMVHPLNFDPEGAEFITAPGQTRAKLDSLLALANELRESQINWMMSARHSLSRAEAIIEARNRPAEPFGIYLLTSDEIVSLTQHRVIAFTVDEALARFETMELPPIVIQAPGQPNVSFKTMRDEFVTKQGKAYRAHERRIGNLNDHDDLEAWPGDARQSRMQVTA